MERVSVYQTTATSPIHIRCHRRGQEQRGREHGRQQVRVLFNGVQFDCDNGDAASQPKRPAAAAVAERAELAAAGAGGAVAAARGGAGGEEPIGGAGSAGAAGGRGRRRPDRRWGGTWLAGEPPAPVDAAASPARGWMTGTSGTGGTGGAGGTLDDGRRGGPRLGATSGAGRGGARGGRSGRSRHNRRWVLLQRGLAN
jgi:hypothetical protein